MKKNLFVTGPRGAGKTTLIFGTLDALGAAYTGFRTAPYAIDDCPAGHAVFGLSPLVPPEDRVRPIDVRGPGDQNCAVVPDGFERFGAEYLRLALIDGAPVAVMDELGFLESGCAAFQRAVFACLDADKPVFGALKMCDAPWLMRIRGRADTLVVEMDEDSREEAAERARAHLQAVLAARAGRI